MIHPLIEKRVDADIKSNVASETAPHVVVKEEAEKPVYTKTTINRMSTSDLQTLAESLGIENAKETSGGKLKAKLIEHFGL